MYVVVVYDIVEDRKRNRIAKVLANYGHRVQKSVFECDLEDQQYLRMKGALEKEIDPEEDSVRYYFLCRRCRGNTEVSGLGPVREEEDGAIIV